MLGGIFLTHVEVVAFLAQFFNDFGLDSRFDQQAAADWFGGAGDREARRFQGGLNIHPVIHNVGDELRVRQRLIGSAHDSEPDCVSPRSMNAGIMVWKGRLRGATTFGCLGSSVNSRAAILKKKPIPLTATPEPNAS